MHHSKIGSPSSARGQNPNPLRTLVCQLPPAADIRRIGSGPLRANFGPSAPQQEHVYSSPSLAAHTCRSLTIASISGKLRLTSAAKRAGFGTVGALVDCFPAHAAFPKWQEGRHPHCRFPRCYGAIRQKQSSLSRSRIKGAPPWQIKTISVDL